jgi:hypothetical protein
MSDLSQLDLFYGELTVNRASVYARLPLPEDDRLTLSGQVSGPRCLNTRTLPVTVYFCDLGKGPTLLSRAWIPDPSFWSPDVPSIYDCLVQLRRGGEILATSRREIGLKAFGVKGRFFALHGKPWVLRGVSTASANELLPREWHAASASFVCDQMDARLAEASQRGAMSVVELAGAPEEILSNLRILAMFPAAVLAVIRGHRPLAVKGIAPNVLLAQPLDPVREFSLQPWADAIWAQTTDAATLTQLLATDRPVIAVRRLASARPVADARALCDELQRDLAPIGQFAGYVV